MYDRRAKHEELSQLINLRKCSSEDSTFFDVLRSNRLLAAVNLSDKLDISTHELLESRMMAYAHILYACKILKERPRSKDVHYPTTKSTERYQARNSKIIQGRRFLSICILHEEQVVSDINCLRAGIRTVLPYC